MGTMSSMKVMMAKTKTHHFLVITMNLTGFVNNIEETDNARKVQTFVGGRYLDRLKMLKSEKCT